MKKRLSKILLVVLVCTLVLCGCESKKETKSTKKIKSVEDLSSKNGTLNCTRTGTVDGGSGEFYYVVKYKGDNLTSIDSIEAVSSEDSSILKEYEDAYKKIDSYYEGIDYYETDIKTTSNKVTHKINIDYERIDIDKLIEIEGEEDNIFENNKAKLSKYLELAKKMGITCKES